MKFFNFFLLSLFLFACKKVEFNKISSTFWSPKLALPIAQGNFTINDILNQADSINKYLDPSKRPSLELKVKESIKGFSIADAVKLPDFNSLPEQSIYSFDKLIPTDLVLINSIAKSNVGLRFPFLKILKQYDPNIQLNQSIDLNFSSGSDLPADFKLKNIKFSKGKIKVNVKQGLPHTTVLKFTFNEITKSSKKLVDSLVYKPGTNFMEIDLTGYEADFSTNKLTFSIDDLILIPVNQDILSTDKIILGVEMTELGFESIQGYFGQLSIPEIKDTIKIDQFKDLKGKFGITNPIIKIGITNGFGIPVSLSLDNFKIITTNPNPNTINFKSGLPFVFPYPKNISDPAQSDILEISKNTVSNIDSLISSKTKEIQLGGKLTVNSGSNPNTTINFIKNTSSIALDADVTIPLTGYASGFTFSDTSDFSFDFDMLKSLQLRVVYRNTLPIDVDAKITFLDDLGNPIKVGGEVLNILSTSNGKLIKSPDFSLYGNVNQPWGMKKEDLNQVPYQTIRITVKESDLPYLKKAAKIIFYGSFDTFRGDKNESVTLYDYYGLDVKLFANVEGNLGLPIK